MGDFHRDRSGRDHGGRGFGGGRNGGRDGGRGGFGRRDRDDRPQMHKAICAECGDKCEVPFRPSGDRPVLCNNCFGGGNDRRGPFRDKDSRRDRDRGGRGNREERDDFDRRDSFKEPTADLSKEQFDMLNAKLDRILKLITPVISVSKDEQAEVAQEIAKEGEAEEKPKAKKASKKKTTE